MTRVFSIQQNFSNGVVTGKASGRTDISLFNNSVEESNNLITTRYGSLTSRPGTKHITTSVTDTAHILHTFKYSDTVSYALEFGDGELRFFYNKAVVTDATDFSNGEFTSDITGWTDNSNGTGAISHATNVLRLTGAGSGNEAIATAQLDYLGIKQYTVTVDVITNDANYKVGTTSGGTEITSGTLTAGTGKTFNFTPTTSGIVYISFEMDGSGNSDIDNVSLSSPEYVIDHPYAVADLPDIQITQSFDVMYIVHKNYAPRKLIRYGNDDWDIETVVPLDGPYLDINTTTTTVTPGAIVGSGVTLTFSSTTGINNDQGFNSGDVGRAIRIKSGPDDTDAVTYTAAASRTTFPITFSYSASSDIEVYTEATGTGVYTLKVITTDYTINALGQVVFGSAPGSSNNVHIRRVNTGTGRWGWGTIASVTNDKVVTVDITDSWHGTNATTEWRLGAWYTSNYPVSAAFHEQRLYYAGQGLWVWASQIGDYDNFQLDDSDRKGTPNDATGIAWQISSTEGNEIQTIASQQGLAVMTTGDVSALITNIGSALSPINQPTITKNAEISCAGIKPVIKDRNIIYVNSQKNAIGTLSFDYNAFGYIPTEVSAFAENLFTDSNIKQITYQSLPNKVIWIVRDDGTFVSYTVQPEYGVSAFLPHTIAGTDAKVLSMTSVPSGLDNDHVYLLVERTINEATVRHIEVMEDFFDNDTLATDSKFTDSSVYYNSTATSSITGLSHLEGEEVRIVTEDGIHPNKTVSSGSITLDEEHTDVIVGLYSNRTVKLHPLQVNLNAGSGRASVKNIYNIDVEFYETSSAKLGTSTSDAVEVIFTNPTSSETQALELFTGLKDARVGSGYKKTTSSYIENVDPLPLTINSIITKFDIVQR